MRLLERACAHLPQKNYPQEFFFPPAEFWSEIMQLVCCFSFLFSSIRGPPSTVCWRESIHGQHWDLNFFFLASVMSDSVWPHRRQPTRLCHPWDSPGKNTGVGCHFLLQCMKVKSESEVAQSCPTFSDPMNYSPPGSSVRGIFQARVLEWGAIAFSGDLNLVIFK